jgi:prevent-host-death family protein
MSSTPLEQPDPHTSALLQVADYLSHPPQFVAIADARATLRQTLELAHHGSVVLTSHGVPTVAVVSFATLEAMRGALLHLLVEAMDASFAQVPAQVAQAPPGDATSEEALEALVDATVRRARRTQHR